MPSLFTAAQACLLENRVAKKIALTKSLHKNWLNRSLSLTQGPDMAEVRMAGRPDKPELVAPRDLVRRRLGSIEGQAALIHAVTHIEFNAINLACDAVARFQEMPEAYYDDWVQVASEEAYHFGLLQGRLKELGYDYGDFPAHNGLWDLAMDTAHDPLIRMALIPRVMEARGLDVTPGMQRRFEQIGDQKTADILDIILHDEIGHVAAGSRWFAYLCEQRNLEPEPTYFSLLKDHFSGGIHCPLHKEARLEAGFSQAELSQLEAMCVQRQK